MAKIQHKKTKELIEATEQEAQDALEAKRSWAEKKVNKLVEVGVRNMSASDIGDVIFEEKKEDLSHKEILEFEKMLKDLRTRYELKKPLEYYCDMPIFIREKGLVSNFIACHWSVIKYLEEQNVFKKIGDHWVICGTKKDNKLITPEYDEFMEKWKSLQELKEKREYAKEQELKQLQAQEESQSRKLENFIMNEL